MVIEELPQEAAAPAPAAVLAKEPRAPAAAEVRRPREGEAGQQQEEESEGEELKDVFDSSTATTPEQRRARAAWLALAPAQRLRWAQTSADVSAYVRMPAGTRAAEVRVDVGANHLALTLGWYGQVVEGPLHRPVKASEAQWCLEDDEVRAGGQGAGPGPTAAADGCAPCRCAALAAQPKRARPPSPHPPPALGACAAAQGRAGSVVEGAAGGRARAQLPRAAARGGGCRWGEVAFGGQWGGREAPLHGFCHRHWLVQAPSCPAPSPAPVLCTPADEPVQAYDELDEGAKGLIEAIQERQAHIATGACGAAAGAACCRAGVLEEPLLRAL